MEFNAKNIGILAEEANELDLILVSQNKDVLIAKINLAVNYELYHLASALETQLKELQD